MKITLEIPADRIANLITSAIEGGDPVTTASRGGWCEGVYWRSRHSTPPAFCDCTGKYLRPWYALAKVYSKPFTLEIIEVDDETTGHTTAHKVKNADFARGLRVMAEKFPHEFAQIMNDEIDAPCAFLQSMLFGDEKYA